MLTVAFFSSAGLLATTLFTFQDYKCDNDVLRMRCPRDTVISVQWAQYGRLATSNNDYLCSAVTWKPLSERRAAAAAAYLQHPSPRTDWLSTSVATTTVPMTTVANNSSWRRAAERITCLASKSLEVSYHLVLLLWLAARKRRRPTVIDAARISVTSAAPVCVLIVLEVLMAVVQSI